MSHPPVSGASKNASLTDTFLDGEGVKPGDVVTFADMPGTYRILDGGKIEHIGNRKERRRLAKNKR